MNEALGVPLSSVAHAAVSLLLLLAVNVKTPSPVILHIGTANGR